MKIWPVILGLLVCTAALTADDAPPIDPSRPDLDKLRSRERVQSSDYNEPFLFSQVAVVVDRSAADQTKKISGYLRKAALPLSAHLSKRASSEKLDLQSLALPLGATTGNQLAGIQKCNLEYCAVKLNNKDEKPLLQKSTTKLATFHQLLLDRIRRYLNNRELKGYEERVSNHPFVVKMFSGASFLKARYPGCYEFFSGDFWSGAKPPTNCMISDSYLREELVAFGPPDKLQPILRISEAFEIFGPPNALFLEIDLYTNHYFDSSARIYEVIPFGPQRSILVMSDILEIDELKKSGLIRFLYKGQMESAVADYQADFINSLR